MAIFLTIIIVNRVSGDGIFLISSVNRASGDSFFAIYGMNGD